MKRKILVVDDDRGCSLIFETYLAHKEDWEVTSSESPKKALRMLMENEFDVVVSDLKMLEMNGLIFLSEVSMKYPKAVRILISANPGKDKASYIDFQYEKGKFSMGQLIADIDKKLEMVK